MNDSLTRARASAAPAPADAPFDVEADIAVVGGGGGGLPAALFARWLGDEVVLLEKAPELGGTARKAAFWYWVPNNAAMRDLGIADPEEDFLRYVARLSRPHHYDPDSPTLGLSEWEFALCRAIYESASPAAELLRERNAVDIRTGHRVQRLVCAGGAVVGVEATTEEGATVRVRARKAVIFATGGFTHDRELRENFLSAPVYGGCAATTNEGDFVRIATSVNAQPRNMNHAWMCPVPLEKAVAGRPDLIGMFSVAGDSMLFVDKRGRRVVNEKLPYNELAQEFFRWDPLSGEYPNLVLIQVWDQRSQEHSASDEYGRLIVPPGTDDSHVIRGETLEELQAAIAERLERYRAHTGGLRLTEDFAANLRASIERFNRFAERGVDEDFGRGERAVQQLFNGLVKEEPGRENPTMWPISGTGPYYAALVTGGTLDTKGGPKATPDGQVVDDLDRPIPGLYGVGNCVASASARAYWAGGATLGPIIAFAYRAAAAAHAEAVKEPSPAATAA